jgi:hypothetical protein
VEQVEEETAEKIDIQVSEVELHRQLEHDCREMMGLGSSRVTRLWVHNSLNDIIKKLVDSRHRRQKADSHWRLELRSIQSIIEVRGPER